MSNGTGAVPGTVIPSGNIITPGGSQGPTGPLGLNAFNTVATSFTVPAVGSTVTATLNDASWIAVGQIVYVDQAGGGPGQPGAMQVTGKTGNQVTLLNPSPPPTVPPTASSSTAGLMNQLSGNTTDFVDGTNACQNLATAITPTVTSVRLRSYNAIGNPTFEVDQRQCGNSFAVTTAGGAPIIDRWNPGLTGTLRYSVQQVANNTLVPGTSYCISRSIFRITMTTTQASLGVGDYLQIWQSVDGPRLRELIADVHSVSLLVRSSIANLKFSVSLTDAAGTRTLAKLCTLGAANTFSLITLPALPVWTGGTTWSTSPGVLGYYFNITLAAGTNIKVAANDTWQTTGASAAAGIDNFAANAGATFDLAFAQHEPGALSTTPIDCPFTVNYDDCQRYFFKTYDYGTALGATVGQGRVAGTNSTPFPGYLISNFPYPKALAKAPSFAVWSDATGVFNYVRNQSTGADVAASNFLGSQKALNQMALGGPPAVGNLFTFQFMADTGW